MKPNKKKTSTARDDRADVCRDCAREAYARAQRELLSALEGLNLIADVNEEAREFLRWIRLDIAGANHAIQTLAEAAGVFGVIQHAHAEDGGEDGSP